MRKILVLCACTFLSFLLMGCGSSKEASGERRSAREMEQERNRTTISLLNRIRRMPGIVIWNNVPVFNRTSSDQLNNPNAEPLYVLNGYIIGNSFRTIDELVQSQDVVKIEALTGPDTSFYGTRGGNGVILITTRQ